MVMKTSKDFPARQCRKCKAQTDERQTLCTAKKTAKWGEEAQKNEREIFASYKYKRSLMLRIHKKIQKSKHKTQF